MLLIGSLFNMVNRTYDAAAWAGLGGAEDEERGRLLSSVESRNDGFRVCVMVTVFIVVSLTALAYHNKPHIPEKSQAEKELRRYSEQLQGDIDELD
jgi:hypothetical protein